MGYTKVMLGVLLACGVAAAQNVYMNYARYDRTEIWLNGQQYYPLQYINPPGDKLDSSVVVVPIQQGTNTLAIWVQNGGWTGGFCASLDLNEVGTDAIVRSDSTWRCMDDTPRMGASPELDGSLLSTASYDASNWMEPGDFGTLADDTGGNPLIWFQRAGLGARYLFEDKAHWLWHPKTTYMRKTFTPDISSGNLLIRGNGYTYKLYVNGQLVGERDTEISRGDAADVYQAVSLNVGVENVIAVEGTCVDSVHMSFMKVGIATSRTTAAFGTDSTWRYSWTNPDGWNNAGYDDSSWKTPGQMDGIYEGKTDPLTSDAHFIWPNSLWFRKTFEAPTVGTLRITQARRPAVAPMNADYFDLRGRRLRGTTPTLLKTNGVVIRRASGSDVEQVDRVLRLVK